MQEFLMSMLECPLCHSAFTWDILDHHEDRIEAAEVRCSGCDSIYPVREGIGLFLTPDLPRNDLWEQAESHLSMYLREHPEVDRRRIRERTEPSVLRSDRAQRLFESQRCCIEYRVSLWLARWALRKIAAGGLDRSNSQGVRRGKRRLRSKATGS